MSDAYTVIIDSFGYIGEDGKPAYAARGTTVHLSADEAERAQDPSVHEPAGAVAPEGSMLANALSTSVAITVNPDIARAQIATLVAASKGQESAVFRDPAGVNSSHVRTAKDPSVAYSQALAGQAGGNVLGLDYSQLSAADLRALAKVRGVDVKGLSGDELAAAVAQSGQTNDLGFAGRSEVGRTDEVYSPQKSDTSSSDEGDTQRSKDSTGTRRSTPKSDTTEQS